MKNTLKFALVGALLAVSAPLASAADCYVVSKAVAEKITAKPNKVLSIVSEQVAANQDCAGSIVKSAIVATDASKSLVAKIVEQAIEAAPKHRALIVTSALAVAPDANEEVLLVNSKYTKSSGRSYSAKGGDYSAKGGISDGDPPNPPSGVSSPLNFIGLPNGGNFTPSAAFLPFAAVGGQTSVVDPYAR